MKKVALLLFTVYYLLFTIPAFAQSVDILWQGETYTPPFFEGLPLWSRQSQITFAAVTDGLPNSEGLVYNWIRNGTVLGLVSGVGINSLSFSDTIFSKPITVGVEVLNKNEELLAENEITLVPVEPMIVVYENHPLYGFLFNQGMVGQYNMGKDETTLAAFPLYFSGIVGLKYVWKSNAGEPEYQSMVTYRAPENAAGTASISVDVSHNYFLRQVAKTSFLIEFGKK